LDFTLVYITAGFLLVLILGISYRRAIRFKIIKLLHGKYSYDYVYNFKKLTNKSPYPYCIKDEILSYLQLAINKRSLADHYTTGNTILFENLPFHTRLDKILKIYGEPDCFNAYLIKNFELKVFGFTKNNFNTSVNTVFYFFLNEMVMGEYIITTSKEITVESISKAILSREGVKSDKISNHFFIDFEDKSSAYFYENGFYILIRYIDWNNKLFFKLIE
jgi:hypothetical protein